MSKIYEEIKAERERQEKLWGGDDHDDQHGYRDWATLIIEHLGRGVSWPFDAEAYRKQLVKVAALAVAAAESYDRVGEDK